MKKTISIIRVAVLHLLVMASIACLIATPTTEEHFFFILFGSKILSVVLFVFFFILLRYWSKDELIQKIDKLCQE